MSEWLAVYFTLAYWKNNDETPDFKRIVEQITLPGKHFFERTNKKNDNLTYIIDRGVPLDPDNSYLAGYFDHYHVSSKKRYKQTDSYNCGVLVAVNMMMRMLMVSQPYLIKSFDCQALHHVRLIYCYIYIIETLRKYGKYPSKEYYDKVVKPIDYFQ